MSESLLLRRILLAYGRTPDVRLYRNTVGALRDSRGRWVTYGLCVGSSDIIGWRTRGGMAQFVALECKTPKGPIRPEQRDFLLAVMSAGGIAGVVRSLEDCYPLIGPPSGSG